MSKLKYILINSIIPLTLMAAPNPPSDLKLKALSTSSVEISWRDNSDNEIGFKILRDGKLITTVGADITSYTDSGLEADTEYRYTVMATDNTIDAPNLSGVHINEILTSNKNSAYDPDFFEFSDYIELKNYNTNSINLNGYILRYKKSSYTLPNITIPANGYLMVWADERDVVKKGVHTNFKLSSKKGEVSLIDSSGRVIDTIKYKKIPKNYSIRVVNDKVVYTAPTPDGKNSALYVKYVASDKPTFLLEGGFYSGVQTISLSVANGGKIYYTTDGSEPTQNSTLYTKPITISKTTVIKARSYQSGKNPSEVVTNSYILNFDTTLPVVSVSINPKFLFDDYIGIYVVGKNGIINESCNMDNKKKNYAQDWDRAAYVQYFDENRNLGFSFNIDLSITGQCSRENAKKNFAYELKKTDGKSLLDYDLYEHKELHNIKDFKTRAGDSGYRLQEILAAAIVAKGELNIDYQDYKIAHLFMNGEYWGIYHIREKKGKDYLRSNYPELGKKIDIVNWGAIHGDTRELYALENFVDNHDLSIDANYQELITMIDEDNFIDYLSLMLYSANTDWLNSNFRSWREQKEGAKWRWMLDDMDRGFMDSSHDTFALIKNRNISPLAHLINKLLENATFRAKLKDRLNAMLDTIFLPDEIDKIVEEFASKELPYIDLEKSKWSGSVSKSKLERNINQIKDFANKRRGVMKDLIKQYLN